MPNLVLYRKYRPLKFADVINQEHVKTTLMNAIANDRVGHAYLFAGPRGVGKTTIARILARAVNCQNRQGSEPCNQCLICMQLLAGNSLDILEIDAASHTGVDNIREIIEHLQYSPASAKFKVIIIDEVHMLSKGAFNALLKTLEEPPKHAIFILATTEVHKVPATIISRTQRFDFKKVTRNDLINLFKFVAKDSGFTISAEAAEVIAGAADGSFRDGLSLLDQVINYTEGEISIELLGQVLGLTSSKVLAEFADLLIEKQTKTAISLISTLVANGADLFQFQKDLLEYLRKLMIAKVENSQEVGEIVKIIEAFQKAGSDLKWASIPSLPLELAVVEVTSVTASDRIDLGSGLAVAKQSQEEIASSPFVNPEPPRNDDSREALEKIKQHWPQILDKVKDYNHSLISSMKLAEVAGFENQELVLVFPYKFHKDIIAARKNRIVIDQVIEDVTGLKVLVNPVLKSEHKNTLESALEIFGGEVK